MKRSPPSYDLVLASANRMAGTIDAAEFDVRLAQDLQGPVRVVLRDFVVSSSNNIGTSVPLHVSLPGALNTTCYDTRTGGPTGHLATIAPATGQFCEYPPAPMTANTTTLSGQPYGNGVYVASVSSLNFGAPWQVFDKTFNANAVRTSFDAAFSYDRNAEGLYIGDTTTIIDGTTYAGEHFTLSLPSPIALRSYSILSHGEAHVRGPNTWVVAGSSDGGATWSLLDTETDVQWLVGGNQLQSFPASSTPMAFNMFRIVVTRVGNTGVGFRDNVGIGEWRLFGAVPSRMLSFPQQPDAGFVTDAAVLQRPLSVTVRPDEGVTWTPQDWSARLSILPTTL